MLNAIRAIIAKAEKEQGQIQHLSPFNKPDRKLGRVKQLLYLYLGIREGLTRIIRCCHCMMISSGTEDTSHV